MLDVSSHVFPKITLDFSEFHFLATIIFNFPLIVYLEDLSTWIRSLSLFSWNIMVLFPKVSDGAALVLFYFIK